MHKAAPKVAVSRSIKVFYTQSASVRDHIQINKNRKLRQAGAGRQNTANLGTPFDVSVFILKKKTMKNKPNTALMLSICF